MEKSQLLAMTAAAIGCRQKAYAPYSRYGVGAAVMGGSGRIYPGCNVENASYGLTMCAERVAVFKAVSEGETVIQAVVIATEGKEMPRPCGACLQVTSEFAKDDEIPIITVSGDDTHEAHTLRDYLPMPFRLEEL